MGFRKIFALGFVLMTIVPAHAQTSNKLKEKLLQTLTRVQSHVNYLGATPMSKIVGEIREKVLIEEVRSREFEPVSKTRDCAYYDRERATVTLSGLCLHEYYLDDIQPWINALMIHEALGAAGYSDENYEWSAMVAALDSLYQRSWAEGNLLKDELEFNGQPLLAEGGGNATGVRGGGDGYALALKVLLLKTAAILANQDYLDDFSERVNLIRNSKLTTVTDDLGIYRVRDTYDVYIAGRPFVGLIEEEYDNWMSYHAGGWRYSPTGIIGSIYQALEVF